MTDRHRAKERAPVVIWKLNGALDDVEAVCDLFDAYDVEWELRLNELGSCSFKIPLGDPFLPEIVRFRFVEVWEEDRRIELFRIVKTKKVRSSGADYMLVTCVHCLDTLNDHVMKGVITQTGTAAALAYLMAAQPLAYWQLGTNDFAIAVSHIWTNYSILRALYAIPADWGDTDAVFTVDTTTFPWTLNVLIPDDTVTALVQPGRNTQLLERDEDATAMFTRLYAYGSGAGTDQLTIAPENITGATEAITAPAAAGQKDVTVADGSSFLAGDHVYIEDGTLWENNEVDSIAGNVLTMVSDLLHDYTAAGSVSEAEEYIEDAALWAAGVRITRIYENHDIVSTAHLKSVADALLAEAITPKLTYTGEVEDLARATGLSAPEFQIGRVLRIWDTKLGKDVDARVIVLRRPDVEGKPGEIEVELSNRLDYFPGYGSAAYADSIDGVSDGSTFGRVLSTVIENGKIVISETVGDLDFSNIVNAGDLPAMCLTPGVSSLYLSSTYMGYYKSGTGWTSYIKSDGTFKFYGAANKYIEWNGSSLTIRGTLVATDITSGTLSADRISGGTLNCSLMTVSNLSATSITAGTLTAVTIRSSSGLPKAEITIAGADQEHVFRCWDSSRVRSYHWSGGFVGLDSSGNIVVIMDSATKTIQASGSGAAVVASGSGAQGTFAQTSGTAAVEALSLTQSDTSEGFIDFVGSERAAIAGGTASAKSVRVELNGTVYRLALYADA